MLVYQRVSEKSSKSLETWDQLSIETYVKQCFGDPPFKEKP